MKRLARITASLAIAALACSFCAIALGCSSNGGPATARNGIEPTAEAVLPDPIPAEDFEAQFAREDDNPVDAEFLMDTIDFSYASASQVLTASLAEEGAVNANYSPISLYYALALCGSGADGATQDEILALLGTDDPAFAAEQAGHLFQQLYTDDGSTTLVLANSLWLDKGVTFEEAYLETATAQYYASVYNVVLGDAATDEAMAAWVSDQTGGTLAPVIQTNPDDVMVILNTVYFKAPWEEQFSDDEVETATFHAVSGDHDAEFLVRTDSYATYLQGDNYLRASLPFADGSRITFVLPDEGVTCEELIATPESTAALFCECDTTAAEITYHIPKFSFDTERSLTSDLQALGIESAFRADADFSNMTSATVNVSDVVQGTHIALDEEGVEASAYTEAVMTMTAEPPTEGEKLDFNLDRPFIFLITSKQGVPLFIGVCGDPTL